MINTNLTFLFDTEWQQLTGRQRANELCHLSITVWCTCFFAVELSSRQSLYQRIPFPFSLPPYVTQMTKVYQRVCVISIVFFACNCICRREKNGAKISPTACRQWCAPVCCSLACLSSFFFLFSHDFWVDRLSCTIKLHKFAYFVIFCIFKTGMKRGTNRSAKQLM